jgi:hypothetical protein
MAFQRADPRPFAPPGFHQHEVQNRTAMARAVIRPPPCIHEDYAIVSIDPLSTNPLQFHNVREVVKEFFEEHMHVGIRDIHPTHLGQALVRFDNIFLSRHACEQQSPSLRWCKLSSSTSQCSQ